MSDMLQVGDLPTPGPSPVMRHYGGILGDRHDLSVRDGSLGDDDSVGGVDEVDRGLRALWRDAGHGRPGEVMGECRSY